MKAKLGMLVGLSLLASSSAALVNAASAAAVTVPPAACDVRAWTVYDMPDGKTYAIVLRSQSGSTSDVRVRLYSDLNDYEVVLPAVKFEILPIDPNPNAPPPPPDAAQYESAPLFFALPRPDPLLLVEAIGAGTGSGTASCRVRHDHTDAWEKMFAPPVDSERTIAQKAALTRNFKEGPFVAASAALTSSTTKTCSVRYERSHGSDVKFEAPVESDVKFETPNAVRPKRTEVAKVLVYVGAEGAILGETLYQSSWNSAFDDAILDAVSKRTYRPEIFRCEGLDSLSIFQMTYHTR
jgi:hypothetical protein